MNVFLSSPTLLKKAHYRVTRNSVGNAIHTWAGVGLRDECARIMRGQRHGEPTGSARLMGAYNLPADYVLHTVGPIVTGRLTARDEAALASCYRSCMALAAERDIDSVAFCCISTGEFHFPNDRAAQIAVETVRMFRCENKTAPEVIFNVFQDDDFRRYRRLLG